MGSFLDLSSDLSFCALPVGPHPFLKICHRGVASESVAQQLSDNDLQELESSLAAVNRDVEWM